MFPSLNDVRHGTERLVLHAESDCGLPVRYYVKEGPAEVSGNELRFTPIPPRSRFPIKVTVVAWQYGIAGKVQTAEPVERCALRSACAILHGAKMCKSVLMASG